ncbi:MAG: DUF3606 domain-containing protein [Bacteroidota bacterium]
MSTHKTKKEAVPSAEAPEGEPFEIPYLRNKFLVSRQKVEEAMRATGNNRQLVEAYLEKYTRKPILL